MNAVRRGGIALAAAAMALFGAVAPVRAAATDAPAPTDTITPQTLAKRLADDAVPYLLDVRSEAEFAEAHIEGARLIPVQALAQRIAEVPADVPVIVYCRSGRRAGIAAELLRARGQAVTELEGSLLGWQAAGLPTVAGN